jgi:hypothetical protein
MRNGDRRPESQPRKNIKELKANLAEVEAALKTKAETTTAEPKEVGKAEVQRYVSCRKVRVVAAALHMAGNVQP